MTDFSADNAAMKAQIQRLERQIATITVSPSNSERDALSFAQSRADSVAAKFGSSVSAPTPGETSLAYRRRLLTKFLPHSERFKGARLDSIDAATLGAVEDCVFQDAVAAARRPESYAPGELRAVQERDEAGRLVTKFVGDPLAWMSPYMTAGNVGRIIRNPKAN